jgi:hypothetical protein
MQRILDFDFVPGDTAILRSQPTAPTLMAGTRPHL